MPRPRHFKDRRNHPCGGGSAPFRLSVLLFILSLGLAKDAAAFGRVTTSSSSLNFGSVTVGSNNTLAVTLTNHESRAVTLSAATVTGAGFSISGAAFPLFVGEGDAATFQVEFAPTAAGAVTGKLSIVTTVPSTITISLSGTGVAPPSGNLSPTSLSFASQGIGTTSGALAVTLTNSGGMTLDITSTTITGTNSNAFAQTNTCVSSLAAGANCTINVTFTPAATGTLTAALTLADNATGSPQTVSLSGTGASAPAAVTLSATSLTFGSQSVDTTSTAQTVTLTNSGGTALTVTSLTLTGTNANAFAQANTCGSSLAAGAYCTINVTFTPAAPGTLTAALTLADNATGSPQTVSLSGTGASASAAVTLSATSLAFGSQSVDTTSTAQTVTLTNSGGTALTVTSLTLTGTNAGDFAQTSTCGSSVAAGANCTIAVLFTPSASGALTAALSIADNATGSPQTVSLSGTGSHDVILSWTASVTPGVTGYYVYRGTTSGGESSTPLNSTLLDATSYTDESVSAGATYYYVVMAIGSNSVTQSAASNEGAATIP